MNSPKLTCLNGEDIKKRIVDNIDSINHINVVNFSEQHAGHKDANQNSHFHITIVSSCFLNLNRIERHKKIMGIFKKELSDNIIHAMSLSLCTPQEYSEIKNNS